MEERIVISEHFHSIQGEGRYQGKPSVFLRVGGCNLDCGNNNKSTWRCDSKIVWSKGKSLTINQILDLFHKNKYDLMLLRGDHLVLTGGEPMLYQNQFVTLIQAFKDLLGIKPFVEIETNGTIPPLKKLEIYISSFNISPKLSNSGEKEENRQIFDVTNDFNFINTTQYFLKFVISNNSDIEELKTFLKQFKYGVSKDNIYLMPACETKEELEKDAERIALLAKENGYNFSNRIHLQIWNKKTGV